VLSLGDDFYKKAFIDLDSATLGSDKMKEAFDRMTKLRSYVDDNFSGRDWNLASAMVIEGKAGVQFMGDWAKGEFIKAGKKPGTDFVCIRFPGTQGAVTFNSDQFAMFNVSEEKVPAQLQMASAIENPTFQSAFNVVKGSAPARTDVPDAPSMTAARRPWPTSPTPTRTAACSAPWRMAMPIRLPSRTRSTTW
jgi:glucose/mannose transport system substrate-binding protein